ncbi:hypothetical protein RXV95_11480 [Novosphingobium sp. ZN18A2]|uniref:hypothetical protein n=1 Tax=Novosphingobium sp. ZN18A2 TaxID=3079861 RepID=UPI0030D4CEBE
MSRIAKISAALSITALAAVLAARLGAQEAPKLDLVAMQKAQAAYDAMPDTSGDGPYPAIMTTDPSLPDHVIYRPRDLDGMGDRKLAVLAWGNGGCFDDGASARLHLEEIASYGYLVVAPGQIRSGPSARLPHLPFDGPGPDGKMPAPRTSAQDVRAGIDWAIAQNTRSGGSYSGRIATHEIAVAGHSCGGLQAIELAADPRVKTVMINNSGVFNGGVGAVSLTQTALRWSDGPLPAPWLTP